MFRCVLSLALAICCSASAEDKSGVLGEALVRMKEEGKPGVVFVIPAGDGPRVEYGSILGSALRAPGSGLKRLLCEAVLVCASTREVDARFPTRKPEARLFLLDPDGTLVEGRSVEQKDLREAFERTIGELVDGADGSRQKARAQREREVLGTDGTKRLDEALAALADEDFEVRNQSTRTVTELAPRSTAILADAFSRAKDAEEQSRIQQVFDGLYAAGPDDTPSARLPFGAAWRILTFEFNGLGRSGQVDAVWCLRFTSPD